MKKILTIAAGIVLGFVVLIGGCVALIGGTTSVDDEARAPVSQAAETSAPAKPKETGETVSQQNAHKTAEEYLSTSAFSHSGLVEQLEFDGYSTMDANYGVDSLDVDWNKQAALAAEAYLEMSAFSRSGLVEQLEFDGFTVAQATHGATENGL